MVAPGHQSKLVIVVRQRPTTRPGVRQQDDVAVSAKNFSGKNGK
jgi:hypothetical protein